MNNIRNDLKEYIEENIFPLYSNNDYGHQLNHIEYVINRSLKFSEDFKEIDLNMMYTIAAFHDIAHYIDKDNHEILSAKMFYENEDMKRFFTEDERIIIKEAIEDHRASSSNIPRSLYGKIVSSADRTTSVDSTLNRTHNYTLKHFPEYNIDEAIERAYNHLKAKYSVNGYAKSYINDEEFENFKEEMQELVNNKDNFVKRYIKVNKLKG